MTEENERAEPGERPPGVHVERSEELHHGRIFDLVHEAVRLPSGLRQELDMVVHAGAVCVAALDGDGRVLLVRQYRHAAGEWLLEIPAGRLEAGEDPLVAARRELEEETGHRAARWSPLVGFFPAPGFCSEWMHLYRAEGLEEVPGGGLEADADEELELVRLPPAEVLRESRDAKTLVAASLLLAGVEANGAAGLTPEHAPRPRGS
jgi:ADP-ribose pyrophosphatase